MEHFSLLQLLFTKWPRRSLVASEVTPDLKIELSDLNNPCTSAFLATKCFFEHFQRKKTKWTCRSACSYLAADNNRSTNEEREVH